MNTKILYTWTESTARVIGAFFGDGTNTKIGNDVRWNTSDVDLFLKCADVLHPEWKDIYIDFSHEKEGYKRAYVIRNADKGYTNLFTSLGAPPQKSEKGCTLPPIPQKYFRDFVIGYWNANGTMTYKKKENTGIRCDLCGHKIFLESINKHIPLHVSEKAGLYPDGKIFRLVWTGSNAIRFLSWLFWERGEDEILIRKYRLGKAEIDRYTIHTLKWHPFPPDKKNNYLKNQRRFEFPLTSAMYLMSPEVREQWEKAIKTLTYYDNLLKQAEEARE